MPPQSLVCLIKVLISFLMVFILVIKKVDLGLSLLAGSALLGLIFLPGEEVLRIVLRAATSQSTIELALIAVFITFLGFIYRETGKLTEISKALEEIVADRRLTLIIIPAMFGMLPMLGGALLSAPVVDEEGERAGIRNDGKTFINVWFRHVIFFIYPLSTFMIFASYLSNLDVASIVLHEMPIFIVAVIAGFIMSFRGIKLGERKIKTKIKANSIGRVLFLLSPILIAIILNALFNLRLLISILIGIATLIAIFKPTSSAIFNAIKKSKLYMMISAVFGVMIFKEVVISSNLPQFISSIVQTLSLPPILLSTFVPLSLGIITGSATGAMAISFPLLSSLNALNPAIISLIYSCCLMGYIISPLHLCLTMTSEYFKVRITSVYPRLIASAAVTIMAQVIAIFLISWIY